MKRPKPQWRFTGKKTKDGEALGEYYCPKGWQLKGAYSAIRDNLEVTRELMQEYGLCCVTDEEAKEWSKMINQRRV